MSVTSPATVDAARLPDRSLPSEEGCFWKPSHDHVFKCLLPSSDPPVHVALGALRQAQDIFDSSAEAEQHTPGWSKAVVVGQVIKSIARRDGCLRLLLPPLMMMMVV